MGVVDVCLYNYMICNLEDQSILAELPKGNSEQIYKHLIDIKETYTIKFAIIGFNQPLMNAIYSVFPEASIMIDPIDVVKMINYYLGPQKWDDDYEEEIAAAVEEKALIRKEIGCQRIYDQSTKKKAIYYYRQWQGDVPLGIKSFHHVIRILDYYYEEIFNYFEFKNMFNHKLL